MVTINDGHVFIKYVPVVVMRIGADHQLAGHAVDGNHVLVVYEGLMALTSDFDHAWALTLKENSSHCVRLCTVSSGSRSAVRLVAIRAFVLSGSPMMRSNSHLMPPTLIVSG